MKLDPVPVERAGADEYRIVTYSPPFRSEVLKLQYDLWGRDFTLNSEYFAWKYEDNPYIHEPILYLVMSRGKLVAMRGVFGSKWRVNEDSCVIPCLADSVVAVAHRRRGIMGLVNEYARGHLAARGFQYVFGLSAGPAVYHSFRNIGARDIGGLEMLAVDCADAALGPLQRGGEKHAVSVSRCPPAEAMADLCARVNGTKRFGHVRDHDYYSWRFENPMYAYHFFYVGYDPMCGYMVIQTAMNTGCSRGKIVDWEMADESSLSVLLRAAIDAKLCKRLEMWACTLTTGQISLLESFGFRRVRAATHTSSYVRTIQFRPTAKAATTAHQWQLGNCLLTNKNHWDLRMIYSDSN